jgi:hypothetical protein
VTSISAPAPEAVEAYDAALRAGYEALEAAASALDIARDEIESARDEARAMFGTPEAASTFSNLLADLHLAVRTITDIVAALPALDEGSTAEEGDAREETS